MSKSKIMQKNNKTKLKKLFKYFIYLAPGLFFKNWVILDTFQYVWNKLKLTLIDQF